MLHDPFRREGPIVTSLADDDFYKLSMLALIHARPDMHHAQVQFAFKNRTSRVELGHILREEDIRRELDHARTLSFNETELRYLGGHFASETTADGEVNRRMFEQPFVDALRDYRLPDYRLTREINGTYSIEARGSWFEVTLWEIHVLQVVAQLYFEHCIAKLSPFERQCVWAQAQSRLLEKVNILKRYPGITIVDFGTRRRACLAWQRYVNEVLLNELGPAQYRGTSNVMLSMENHTVPMGTFAHELVMGMSGIMHGSNEDIVASQNATFDRWYEHFAQPLSVALSDTYGTDFFLKSFGPERAAAWKGTRQDSGDPFAYGEKLIRYYESVGVSPRTKLIVFSDGLDVDTIRELYERFSGRITVTFGWGTNLTNDFGPDLEPLSLVMKLLECNGHKTVKLSDNLDKAMGKPEDVERFKRIFGYTGTFSKQPRY
ncbi:MAG TPA: nicotinate phosphoribosyltransferase [Candidatus Paceibacterota bacterium]|nr:nicotinate phosphoribosyltransferase [Candidatus Paceibacterota bacterium]